MNVSLVLTAVEPGELRRIIDRAADTLAGAVSAAEILDARDQAAFAYDMAKAAGRLAKAKSAHDDVIARAYRAQADALEIEAVAKRRLADEYDAAQERGEIAGHGGSRGNQHTAGNVKDENVGEKPATAADVGLSRPQVFEARQIRDAIEQEPGILRRVLDEILEAGEEPTKAKLRKELAPAIADVRKAVQSEKKERRVARELDLSAKIRALPTKKFGVILADPEWRFKAYSAETGMDRSPDNHYPTSETDDIAARDVGSIAADDCVLFLWATAPMLPDALRVMAEWGFEYKTHAIWFKQRTGDGRGTGYWFLGEHELLLVGTKGNVPAPAMGTQFRSVFSAPVGEHSEKPEISLEMIEAYFPSVPKIELNRRGPARPGWDAWGAEADVEAEPAPPEVVASPADDPELYARAVAVVCGMADDLSGRLIRATRISERLGVSWEVGVSLATRIEEAGPLSLADKLVATGLVPNSYLLELNRGLALEGALDLPSRLFRFPVEFMDAKRTGAESRLLLRHPLLWQYLPVADFLDDIEEKTGIRPEWQATDEFGRDFGEKWRWYHAVDLCNEKHWKDLLATAQFTDRDCIFGAVRSGLEYKGLSLKSARAIMAHLESVEPEGRSADLLLGNGLMPYRHDDKKLISPNISPRGEAGAWLVIHGLEDGFFKYAGKFLSVTPEGMARREKVKEVDVPLPLELEDAGDDPDTAEAEDPALPPAPGANAPIDLTVGRMRNGSFARLSVRRDNDGRYTISTRYEIKDFVSGPGPIDGTFIDFRHALHMGLRSLRMALETVVKVPAEVCTDSQRAAASGGVAWIDARIAGWRLDQLPAKDGAEC